MLTENKQLKNAKVINLQLKFLLSNRRRLFKKDNKFQFNRSSKVMSVNSYSEEQELNLPQRDYFTKSQQNLTSSLNNQNTQISIQFQDSIYWQQNSSTASTMDCNIKEEQALYGEQILARANILIVELSAKRRLDFYFKLKSVPRLMNQLQNRKKMTEYMQEKIFSQHKQIRQFFVKFQTQANFERICKQLRTVAQRLFDLSFEWQQIISNYSKKLKDLQQNEGQLEIKKNKICLSLEKKVVSKEERIYTPKIIGEKLNRMKTSTEEVKQSSSIELLSPIKQRDEK